MPGKFPKDYTVDEVCLWVFAVGLDDKVEAFRENSVDGGLLVTLGEADFKDLGLSSLQGKRILRALTVSNEFAAEGDLDRLRELEQENKELRAELNQLKYGGGQPPAAPAPAPVYVPAPAPAPVYVPAPAPAPTPVYHSPPPPPPGAPVVKGAATGAAKGAVLGAVAGAIAGDAAQGAKIGAAVGATKGGMDGLGARRRARLRH